MAVKTLSLRIDEDLLTRIDQWGMSHLEDGEVRYNRNSTLKRLIETALALPDQEEVGEGEETDPVLTLADIPVETLLDLVEERQRRVATEERTETVNQVLTGTKLISDGLYRDISTDVHSTNQSLVDDHLLEMGKDIDQLGEGIDHLTEAEEAREAREEEKPWWKFW